MSKCFNQYFRLCCERSTRKTSTARDHPLLFRGRGEKKTHCGKATARPVKVDYCPVLLKLTVVREEFPSASLIFLSGGWQSSRGGSTSSPFSFALLGVSLLFFWMINCFIFFLFALLHLISAKCFRYSGCLCTSVLRCFGVPQPPADARRAARGAGSRREFAQSLQLPRWIIKGNTCLGFEAGQSCKARDKTHVWPCFLFASVMSKAVWDACAQVFPGAGWRKYKTGKCICRGR